jgi:hypothetical protein
LNIKKWLCSTSHHVATLTANWPDGLDACNENKLVHSELFQVYKVRIWAVKMEIIGIDPAFEQ